LFDSPNGEWTAIMDEEVRPDTRMSGEPAERAQNSGLGAALKRAHGDPPDKELPEVFADILRRLR
jgi:hypothetical protein